MMARIKVLISHYHEERALADAWKELLKSTSLGVIEAWYSSDSHAAGGMTIGIEWRDQLHEKLAESNFILAIQTPTSAGRPWVMWECGVASGIDKERGIIPIIYSMKPGELANPISSYQLYQGEDENQVRQVCERLTMAADLHPEAHVYTEPLKRYFNAIKLYRPRKAIHPEQIEIWRDRFEKLIQSGRVNEIFAMRQQMYASLGKPFNPVDPSVHELLSKILLDQGYFQDVIEEVDYALKLLDGDTVLLYRKALALVELHNLPEAKTVIDEIISRNETLRLNSEFASLQGRFYREQWKLTDNPQDLDAAIEAYYRAYQADKTQYYPGVNAATLSLTKGDTELATQIFQDVLKVCQQLQQQQIVSYWVDFTVGEVYLGLGDVEAAIAEYKKGLSRTPPPPSRDRNSALKGVRRVVNAKKLPNENVTNIEAILKQ
ncbi:TRAFs-binding domain-containing protein [Scytonema sp. PCC 10023]|uniref:TRAFs-binding domain-containing protein n=1 Tax=Scytonema sp. PCC 10023 TaxID=1680591 RepID=UPI0039C67F9B